MSTLTLEKAFAFDADELALNRAGRISILQRRRLTRSAWLPFIVLMIPVITCGLLSWIGSRNSENISVSIPIFLLLTLLILIGLGWVGQQQRVSNTESAGVGRAFGRIKFADDKRKLLLLEIDGLVFRLFKWQHAAFDEKQTYRIYYLKASMQVLSAEIVNYGD